MNLNKVIVSDFAEVLADSDMKAFENSTIMVTGATGMIGSLLIKFLLYYNELTLSHIKIIGVARDSQKAQKIYGDCLNDSCFTLLYKDITEPIDIESNLDYIFHTASATNSKFFVTHPAETMDTMYIGTKNILELARKKSLKSMIYLSSMEMYGKPDAELEYVKEENLGYIDILNVRSSYSEGKRISECLCAAYCHQFQVPVKIARLAQTFGAGVLENDNRVYAQFARSVIEGKDIVLHTNGKSWGNYCYTSDLIKALILLNIKGNNGEAYNICNEENTRMIVEMAELVVRKFGNDQVKLVFDIPEDNLKYGYAPEVKMRLSSQKLRGIGWNPQVKLEEMYRRMIQYMKLEFV
ncbi:NAD-dependent epimerase/dehydratase family protein [Lachnoclostridium sp. An181]|uniref:NAD-dependent epimerase/dehydratase family protein n=1 Tax=Lachnoclostridium sp. An181 TaxID=1965575 RepID=UPI000B3937FC|nr:NAD-dependent epimerase/dehydratase family protein [Lachnoclostridium sp. An181]OUP49751.1 nucleotide sugar dehydratase [Lachnoclostridium sp. An181]